MNRLLHELKLRIKNFRSQLVLSDYVIIAGVALLALAAVLIVNLRPAPDIALSPQFDRIKDYGALRVGLHPGVEGLCYTNETIDEAFGLEVDLARAISLRLFGEGKTEFVSVTNQSKSAKLTLELVDVCVAQFTPDTSSEFHYSQPYYADNVVIVVPMGTRSSPIELSKAGVGVLRRAGARAQLKKWSDANKLDINISYFEGIEDMQQALEGGKIEAYCIEYSLAKKYARPETEILPDSIGEVQYAIAVRAADEDMLALCNDVVARLKDAGALDSLIETWGLS